MSLPDQNKQVNESLTEKIEELDSLINTRQNTNNELPVLSETTSTGHARDPDIPILDEVVSFEEQNAGDRAIQQVQIPGATSAQLLELIDNIEHRLTDELESMVKTIKSSMKKSILDELKNRVETNLPESDVQPLHQPRQKNDL